MSSATAAAIDNGPAGIYNIVDDEPAPVREWLPVVADELGAGPPRRIPRVIGRLLGGQASTIMMTTSARAVIRQVTSVSDPDQLRHLGPLADLGALRGRGTDGADAEPTGDHATRVAGAGTARR